MDDRYLTAIDMDNYDRYFKFYYHLLESPEFEDLDIIAKIIYCMLLDRRALSIKNKGHFTDENGYIYVIAKNEEIGKWVGRSEPVIVKLKKQLAEHGLLIEKRQGHQLPNLLYPQKLRTKESLVLELKNLKLGTKESLVHELKNLKPNKTNNNQTNITRLIEPRQHTAAAENIIFKKLKEAFEEKNVGETLVTEVEDLLSTHGRDLVLHALDETILGKGSTIYYTKSMLTRWEELGLQTVEQVKEYKKKRAEERRNWKRRPPKKVNIPSWSNQHPDYKPPVKTESSSYLDTLAKGEELPFDS